MASPNESNFVQDVVVPSNLRGRELGTVIKTKEQIEKLNNEIAEWRQKVKTKREECKPLSKETNTDRKAYKKAERDYNKAVQKCSKLKSSEKVLCIRNTSDEKQSRNQLKIAWQKAKKISNKCQTELKNYVKTLRSKRARIQKKRKALKKLKKKRRKNRKKKKRRRKQEVEKELVAGQCVADHICGTVRGDPHLKTFDGESYDCQGDGVFVLAKAITSEDSSFEIQARFQSIGKSKMVSITTAVAIDTGFQDDPDMQVFATRVNGTNIANDPEDYECELSYYVSEGDEVWNPTDFSTPVDGISYEGNGDDCNDKTDYLFFTNSGVMYTVYAKKGKFGCVLNSKVCLPPSLVQEEDIVGLLGTPDGIKTNEWTTPSGAELDQSDTGKAAGYAMCTTYWCVRDEEESLLDFPDTPWSDIENCDTPYDSNGEDYLLDPPDECENCCTNVPREELYAECVVECAMAPEGEGVEQCVIDIEDAVALSDIEKKCKDPEVPEPEPEPSPMPSPTPEPEDKKFTDSPKPTPPPTPAPTPRGASSGDPHFKTWTGDKYDYHGECDLVLVDNPSFSNGLGLRLHIRTTSVKHFSFIEKVALQIGDDVLEFDNDVENFLINGAKVEKDRKHHKTMLGDYVVRRDPKAISVRLADGTGPHQHTGAGKIDFHMRKNGFPAIIVDAGHSDIFKGSLGLLGEWGTGRKVARDGKTVIELEHGDATAFALEWQVRDTEPMLFKDSRFPQYPTVCTPPAKMLGDRLGSSSFRKEAEEACAHWKEDKEDCIFDVMATQDVLVAEEGHIVHVM